MSPQRQIGETIEEFTERVDKEGKERLAKIRLKSDSDRLWHLLETQAEIYANGRVMTEKQRHLEDSFVGFREEVVEKLAGHDTQLKDIHRRHKTNDWAHTRAKIENEAEQRGFQRAVGWLLKPLPVICDKAAYGIWIVIFLVAFLVVRPYIYPAVKWLNIVPATLPAPSPKVNTP